MGKNYMFDKAKLGQIMTCIISVFVNFACELGQIMTRYDLWARRFILSNVRIDSQLDLILILVNFSCELEQIMTNYDFQEARRLILSNVRTDFNLT